MKNHLRSILSGSAGIATIAFTAVSAATAGFDAASTLMGVGAFVLWGLVEIALLESAPRALAGKRPVYATANGVPAVVEFPVVGSCRAA